MVYEQANGIWSFLLKNRGRVQARKLSMNYSWAEKRKTINVCPLLKCHQTALLTVVSVSAVALEQLLNELEDFLRILDKENLSSTALVKKSFLSDLLRMYTKTSGTGRESWRWGGGLMWEPLWGLEAPFSWRLAGKGDEKIKRRKWNIIFSVTSNCLCKITLVMCPALQAKDSQDSWSFLFSLLNLKFI